YAEIGHTANSPPQVPLCSHVSRRSAIELQVGLPVGRSFHLDSDRIGAGSDRISSARQHSIPYWHNWSPIKAYFTRLLARQTSHLGHLITATRMQKTHDKTRAWDNTNKHAICPKPIKATRN